MSLIDSFKTDDIAVTRFAKGEYDKGIFKQGEKETLLLKAVVIPTKGRELLKLSEGQRTKESITIYSKDKLCLRQDKNSSTPDHLIWKNNTYQVEMVEDRTVTDINHYKSIAVKVEHQSDKRKLKS